MPVLDVDDGSVQVKNDADRVVDLGDLFVAEVSDEVTQPFGSIAAPAGWLLVAESCNHPTVGPEPTIVDPRLKLWRRHV